MQFPQRALAPEPVCSLPEVLIFFSAVGKAVIKISYIRGPMLVLAVLLAGAANLLSVSCDADHDADTPPLVIEFSFVTGAQAGVHAQRSIAAAPVAVTLDRQALALEFHPLLARPMAAHHLLEPAVAIPLLC